MKNNQRTPEDRPAIIHFSDPQKQIKQKDGKTSVEMKKRMKRTPSTASHTIIAYRTLSITVSEYQSKGVKKGKKAKKDLAEGNYYTCKMTNEKTLRLKTRNQ